MVRFADTFPDEAILYVLLEAHPVGLEDTHADAPQNIEFAIVSYFREVPDLTDYPVTDRLDALIEQCRAESRSHTPK